MKLSLRNISRLVLCASLALLFTVGPQTTASAAPPLANAVILIIRHAEKPPEGNGLTPSGIARSHSYVAYFKSFKVDGVVRPPDYVFAAADSSNSMRPRLTVTPLSNALNLPVDLRFKDKDVAGIASALSSERLGKTILIAWHHEQIADLLAALGVDPTTLLPDGDWPENVYDWVIELRYDSSGNLVPSKCKRLSEHLMPGDTD